MIEIATSVLLMFMFVIWTRKDVFNLFLKTLFLVIALWLAIDTASEMGYIINMENM